MPKGRKRPGDVIGTAIKVAKIATGVVAGRKRVMELTQPLRHWSLYHALSQALMFLPYTSTH